MVPYLICLIFSTLFIGVPIIKIILTNEENNDLLFLVLSNALFLISTSAFYFYFNEHILAFSSSIFLWIYTLLLCHKIKKEKKEQLLFTIPYFLFTTTITILFGINIFL